MLVNKPLVILPAVDIQDGKAVRLSRNGLTEHGSPQEVIEDFRREGAEWIHLVDLDAAFGRGDNRELLLGVMRDSDLPVQLSGGISDADSLKWALSTPASRINISTAGLVDLDWIQAQLQEHGDRLAISLDVQGDQLVARGSRVEVGTLDSVLEVISDAHYLVVTDNERDGNLTGPNIELLEKVISSTSARVIASGGVANLEDIDSLRQHQVFGAVVGKALYSRSFTLAEALRRAGS